MNPTEKKPRRREYVPVGPVRIQTTHEAREARAAALAFRDAMRAEHRDMPLTEQMGAKMQELLRAAPECTCAPCLFLRALVDAAQALAAGEP